MNETIEALESTAVKVTATYEELLHAAISYPKSGSGLDSADWPALWCICCSAANGSDLVGDGVQKVSRSDIARSMERPLAAVDKALKALVDAGFLLDVKDLGEDTVECALNISKIFSVTPLVRAEKV